MRVPGLAEVVGGRGCCSRRETKRRSRERSKNSPWTRIFTPASPPPVPAARRTSTSAQPPPPICGSTRTSRVPADARGNASGAIVRGRKCQMSLGAGAILRDSKNPLSMRVAGGFCQNADLQNVKCLLGFLQLWEPRLRIVQ